MVLKPIMISFYRNIMICIVQLIFLGLKKFKASNDLMAKNSVNEFDIFATTRPMAHKAKGNF